MINQGWKTALDDLNPKHVPVLKVNVVDYELTCNSERVRDLWLNPFA